MKELFMIKLIAVDMDGTFLNSTSEYNQERFHKIHSKLDEKGIHFVVASGNQYFQLKDYFTEYNNIDYIAENGALICNPKKVYVVHSFSEDTVKPIENFLIKQKEINFLVCGKNAAYALNKMPKEYFKFSSHYYHRLEKVQSLDAIHDKILKFSIRCPNDKTDYYIKLFEDNLGKYSNITSRGHGDIDIIQISINKVNGLRELGKILNIKLSEMCAFGDGGNNLEMIQEVSDGIAMKNASPLLFHITDTNDEEGVLNYIENNIL